MFKTFSTILVMLVMLSLNSVQAEDPALEAFNLGNQAYQDNDFNGAIEHYQKALALDFEPSGLYYNLANAYYREQHYGNAIANYRKALLLSPRDADIKENLKIARSQTMDNVAEPELPKAVRSFLFIYYYIGTDEIIWCGAILIISLSIFGILKIYFKKGFNSLFKTNLGLMLLVFMTIGTHLYFDFSNGPGVVNCASTTVRSGPNSTYPDLFVLHDGVEVKIIETEGDWCKIQISANGEKQRGWLEANHIIKI